jgi:hypothetical protein
LPHGDVFELEILGWRSRVVSCIEGLDNTEDKKKKEKTVFEISMDFHSGIIVTEIEKYFNCSSAPMLGARGACTLFAEGDA